LRPLPLRAQNLTVVRLGTSLDDGVTPLLYALHVGAFKAVGLDVQVQGSQNGAALAAAVAGGAIDIAKSALMSLITAYTNGVHFKIVAGAAEYVPEAPTTLLCCLKTSSINSVLDAAGKTVAVSTLRAMDSLGTQALVEKAGGDSSGIKFIELRPAAMLAAMQQGRCDMACMVTPALGEALEGGLLRTFGDPYGGIAPKLMIAGWFGSADYVQHNPSVVQRFAKVMLQANAYSNTHHAETAPLLAQYAQLDPAVIAKMTRLTNVTDPSPKLIQPAIDAAAKYKYIDAPFPAKELLA
jgi:NitT/TauT family transport system substrate-binding protein